MTPEEIDAVPAGRELDALIAKHVFADEWDPDFFVDDSGQLRDAEGEAIPSYSTDIAAAWVVAERMAEIPETIEGALRAVGTKFGLLVNQIDTDALTCHTASEAAEFICRAALKAVVVQ